MKRFLFRLDRLLQLRSAAEREHARSLVASMRLEEERRRIYRESAERLAGVTEQLRSTPRPLSTAGTLQNLELTLKAARIDIQAAEAAHGESLVQVENEMRTFEEARVARRAIERLKEQRRATWSVESTRQEQHDIDEVALHRARPGMESA
jgi:flagellar export protein FliJ